MDIAKFLDQPIRFNPRRPRASLLSIPGSLSPSPSHESAAPTPSLTPTSSFEFDATLSSEKCFFTNAKPQLHCSKNLISRSRSEGSSSRETSKNLSEIRPLVKDMPFRANKSHERQCESHKISLFGMSGAKDKGLAHILVYFL
jgi:hypothetical protein